MRWVKIGLMICLSGMVQTSFATVSSNEGGVLQFQIIESQLNLDYNGIKKAELIDYPNGKVALKIELKPIVADEIKQLTHQNMGKIVNLIFNKRVISTSLLQGTLGEKLLLTGFTRAEAQLFLSVLKTQDAREVKRRNPETLLNKINEAPQLIQ